MPCCSVAGLTICSEAKMPALEDSFHEPVQPLTKNIFFQPNCAALNPAFKQAPRYRAVPSNPIQVQDYCDNKQLLLASEEWEAAWGGREARLTRRCVAAAANRLEREQGPNQEKLLARISHWL